MKKSTSIMVSIMIIFGILSCNKDDDSSAKYYFEYDGEKYALDEAFIIRYGYNDNYENYEFDLFLYSGMEIYDPDSVKGSGPIVGFNIFSNSNKIESGSYPGRSEYGISGTFSYGHFLLAFDPDDEWQHWTAIESGTLDISNNNGHLDISFDCNCEDGKKIKGIFKGEPDYFNAY